MIFMYVSISACWFLLLLVRFGADWVFQFCILGSDLGSEVVMDFICQYSQGSFCRLFDDVAGSVLEYRSYGTVSNVLCLSTNPACNVIFILCMNISQFFSAEKIHISLIHTHICIVYMYVVLLLTWRCQALS